MLIIGCGNPDRGDDAAGILVARRLRQLGLDALEHTGDGFALLDLWNGIEEVILVDAMVSGGNPGAVSVWDPGATPRCSTNDYRCSTHVYGPSEAIELARVLGRLPPRMRIYGIEASQFQPGAPVSREVLAAVDQVVGEITQDSSKDTKLQ
jgi:hydrogenase maturation protease